MFFEGGFIVGEGDFIFIGGIIMLYIYNEIIVFFQFYSSFCFPGLICLGIYVLDSPLMAGESKRVLMLVACEATYKQRTLRTFN